MSNLKQNEIKLIVAETFFPGVEQQKAEAGKVLR